MTLEQLLGSDADTLSKLTDAELLAFFDSALSITRIDRQTIATKEKNSKTTRISQAKEKTLTTQAKLNSIRDKFGGSLDLAFLDE